MILKRENLKRFEIELDGLIWDSGYGERDAVLNATVLWNLDLSEIDKIAFGGSSEYFWP
jgi:hypothetical protein